MPLSLQDALPFLGQLLNATPPPPDPNQPAAAPSAPQQPAPQPQTAAQPTQDPNADLKASQGVETTKGHKLLQILQGGLIGGLSGYAANAESYARTGRNGGAGIGIGAGFGGAQGSQLPYQQQMQGQQLQQAQAQTELTRQAAQNVNIPGLGSMPMGLAKVLFPQVVKGQTATTVQGMKGQTAQGIEQSKEQSAERIHRFMPIPNVGMFDTQTRQVMPGTEQGITITPEIAADHNLPEQFIGKPMKISDLNGMMRAENQAITTVQGAAGPAVVNKKEALRQGGGGPTASLGLGSPAIAAINASPVQVAGSTPGDVVYTSAGQAKAEGATGPASASVQAPKQVLEQATSGQVGQQMLAIGTAREHMKLFSTLATALDNNNSQMLNKIGNAIGVQFGSDKATNLKIASQAFGGEVGRAFDGAGVIGKEREQASAAYADYLSKGQFSGAVQTVDKLLAGKQKAAHDWFDKGMQGTPDFGQQTTPTPKAAPVKTKPSGGKAPAASADPFAQFGGKAR